MSFVIALIEAYALTPDGGLADPTHPIYAALYVLKLLAGM